MKIAANEYLKKPYSRTLIPVGDGTYFAEILEFPGCFAEGQTPGEAYKNLDKVAESWIEAAQDLGQEIPAPFATRDFSGRIALRIPRSIHKQAAKFAEMDDTSLNQFFLGAIAARVGAEDLYERLSNKLEAKCASLLSNMSICTISLHTSLWTIGSEKAMTTQMVTPELPDQSFITLEYGDLQIGFTSEQFLVEKEIQNG